MLKLSQQTADSYAQGFSAFMSMNRLSAAPSMAPSRLPPVSQTFMGAHNQGLARRIPANSGSNSAFSIADVVTV